MTGERNRNVRDAMRVRKRAPAACVRCRRQKIKCSGIVPCEQCKRRSIHCDFDASQQKVLVTQSYIAELQQRAAVNNIEKSDSAENQSCDTSHQQGEDDADSPASLDSSLSENGPNIHTNRSYTADAEQLDEDNVRSTPAGGLSNPLDPINSDGFTLNKANRRYFLGVSSNWSFGRRALNVVHRKVTGTALPATDLLFEGATYDLGWDGQRTSAAIDVSAVPTADFATYLINAVKFHCGRLYHMFDEIVFMRHFRKFYDDPGNHDSYPRLWYIHFLIILAFGKAFIVRASNGKRPPGVALFVQAMQLLPDVTFMFTDTVQSIEILCCAALYLQCLDMRSSAYTIIGQALRLAVEQGLHTDMRSLSLPDDLFERCKETWWSVYTLDRQMTSLMGVPISISEDDLTAPLPSFSGSISKQHALAIHIKLAKANAVILQTVYGKSGGRGRRFLASMKEALKTIAAANEELNKTHSLDLNSPASGICRLSATLHLFHHQALILATRPLLYSFLLKRLELTRSLRVSSSRGARSLVRICIGSAQQCLTILEALQSQGLLESFVPFDREATFSSAVVIAISARIDPSLVRDSAPRLSVASRVLDEMIASGNLIAEFQKRELNELDSALTKLHETSALPAINSQIANTTPESSSSYNMTSIDIPAMDDDHILPDFDFNNLLREWNTDDGLSSQQLIEVADSLDFGQLNWPIMGDLEGWG